MTATNPRELWIGGVFVVEWDLLQVADGEPLTDATVVGTVTRPTGAAAAMVVDHEDGSNTWRLSYPPSAAGTYGYRATATVSGVPAGAIGGSFVVNRDRTGADPITLDTDEPIGLLRLLITDTDEAFPLFTDSQLTALLALEGDSVKRAAAAALETIATSETLIGKKITTQDLSTDGPAVAKELMARAKELRRQADSEAGPVDEDPDHYGFDYQDFTTVGTHPGVWWI
jgi:hypothetical protein